MNSEYFLIMLIFLDPNSGADQQLLSTPNLPRISSEIFLLRFLMAKVLCFVNPCLCILSSCVPLHSRALPATDFLSNYIVLNKLQGKAFVLFLSWVPAVTKFVRFDPLLAKIRAEERE
jgi:hypothetical protein